jgi:hypothetical protein
VSAASVSRSCGWRASTLAVGVPPEGAVEVGQADRGRHEARVEAERRPQGGLGLGGPPLGRVEQAQVEVRLRAIGVELLGRDVLGTVGEMQPAGSRG